MPQRLTVSGSADSWKIKHGWFQSVSEIVRYATEDAAGANRMMPCDAVINHRHGEDDTIVTCTRVTAPIHISHAPTHTHTHTHTHSSLPPSSLAILTSHARQGCLSRSFRCSATSGATVSKARR